MLPKSQRGFTLLEVLMAGFILFLTIAAMTLVYRGALFSSEKADKFLQMSSAVMPIRQIISDKLRQADYRDAGTGDGSYGYVDYSWNATLTYSGKPSRILQEDTGTGQDLEYYLWRVDVSLSSGTLNRKYQFSMVTWR
tara:strand:- start:2 stop:415 length:414 start_codon:yes stop_codon:yes gene_type:complete